MKKVLYGVALTLFAGVSVGSLQSCKDDVNDLRTQTTYDLNKLRSQLTAESARLDAEIARLDGRIDAEIAARRADIAAVNGLIEGLQSADRETAEKIEGILSRLNGIDGVINDIKENYATKAYVDGVKTALEAEIEALKEFDGVVWEQIEQINQVITWLNNALMQAESDIEELKEAVDDLNKMVDQVIAQLDQEISGILIQRVKSPVFGDFSLPIGVKSNMLFNWFGFNDRGQDVTFPDGKGQFSANGDPGFSATKLGWGAAGSGLAHEYEVVPDGYYASELSLGKVYVTLNPIGKVFNGTDLNIVDSQGNPLPFTVSLEPSEELLTYGYTRDSSTIDTGLYEGEVKLTLSNDPEENEALSAIRLSLDDQLVSAMKDAVKDPTKRNAAHLLKTLYDSMNGKLTAYALEYGWNTSLDDMDPGFSGKSYRVLSQYDLAVAAARPLGFNFLADVTGPSNAVPTISNIDNFIAQLIEDNLNKITVEGQNIKVNGQPVSFGSIEFKSREVEKEVEGVKVTVDELYAIVSGLTVGTQVIPDFEVVCDSADSAAADVTAEIKEKIGEVVNPNNEDTIKAEIDVKVDLVLLQMQNQINDVVSKLNGQIKEAFTGMGNSADSYINKVNRAVDLYNKVANKINSFLHNPNHYLQAAVFYEAGNNMGIVSGDPKNPTVFNKAGGNALSVFLSSYTGELIVPAYKKFVACTKINDSTATGAINKGQLNTVLDGDVIRVQIPADKLVAGNVYEFVYQALDYRGFTSTRKFYIEVK